MSFLTKLKHTFIKTGSTRLSLSILFIVAIILSFTQTLDVSSKHHIDKSFNRALITFGIAKTLNGVISVAQGTEIAIQPAGIGINLTPGEILDPVNDLVERFSWIMLASTTALGVQKIFLTMSASPLFNYLFSFILITGLISLFIKTTKHIQLRILVLRISLVLVVIRFAVPITGLANEAIYQSFLEQDYVASADMLESTTHKIGELNENEKFNQPDVKKKSVWESAKAFYDSTSEMLDINKRIDEYKQAAKETTNHIINLIVVFIFQTIIIPMIFIFIIYYFCRFIITVDFDYHKIQTSTGL